MTSFYNNQTVVKNAIAKVGGVEYPNCCVWASTEIDQYVAWVSDLRYSDYYGLWDGGPYAGKKQSVGIYVRPVLEF